MDTELIFIVSVSILATIIYCMIAISINTEIETVFEYSLLIFIAGIFITTMISLIGGAIYYPKLTPKVIAVKKLNEVVINNQVQKNKYYAYRLDNHDQYYYHLLVNYDNQQSEKSIDKVEFKKFSEVGYNYIVTYRDDWNDSIFPNNIFISFRGFDKDVLYTNKGNGLYLEK